MILDCGHAPTASSGLGTGYARHSVSQKTMCYSCADEFERKRSNMADTRQFVAYISGDARNVTTWTGGQIMKITQHGMSRSGFHGSEIHYWRAVDDGGRQWYGRNGGPGMSVMMRRAGVKNRGY